MGAEQWCRLPQVTQEGRYGAEGGREKATDRPVGRDPGRVSPRTRRWEDA